MRPVFMRFLNGSHAWQVTSDLPSLAASGLKLVALRWNAGTSLTWDASFVSKRVVHSNTASNARVQCQLPAGRNRLTTPLYSGAPQRQEAQGSRYQSFACSWIAGTAKLNSIDGWFVWLQPPPENAGDEELHWTWYIDGSMLNGDWPECRVTGFAIVVVSRHHDLIAYEHGCPPSWCSTATSAETWALHFVLIVEAPSIRTDCQSLLTIAREWRCASHCSQQAPG